MNFRSVAYTLFQKAGLTGWLTRLSPSRALYLWLIVAALFLLLPIYAMVLYTYYDQRERAIERAVDQTVILTEIVSLTHLSYLEATRQLLAVLAELPEVRTRERDRCSALFIRLVEANPLYADMSAADSEGNIFCTTPPLEESNIAHHSYFSRALQNGGFAIGDYESTPLTNRTQLTFAHPFIGPRGVPDGVVTASIDLLWLHELAISLPLPSGTTILHVDSNGTLLARYPEREGLIGQNVADHVAVAKAIGDTMPGTVSGPGFDGIERLYAYRPLANEGEAATYLIAGFDREELFAVANENFLRSVSALIFVTILALLGAWQLSRKVLVERIANERKLTRLQSEFLSLATHQLRNPVAAIQLYGDILSRKGHTLSKEEHEKTIAGLRRAAEQLSNLVVDLLEATKIETGAVEIERQSIDLQQLLKDAITSTEALRNGKDLRISESYPEHMDKIRSDPRLITHVVDNLLSNAIKYTPQGGSIAVTVEEAPKHYVVKISDSGIGIPQEEHGRIFERFFRSTNVRGPGPEGTGLGLFIAKSLVERLGGMIGFDSAEGKGTTFWFTLPRDGRA